MPATTPSLSSNTPMSRSNWLFGLSLFLMPLGHLPLQLAYGLLFLGALLRYRDLSEGLKKPQLQPLLGAVVVYICVCAVGAWAAGFEGGIWSAGRLREHFIVFIFVGILTSVSHKDRLRLTSMMLLGGLLGVVVAWVQFAEGISPLAELLNINEKQRSILHPTMPTHLAGTGLLYDRIAFSLVSVMLGIFGLSFIFQNHQRFVYRIFWGAMSLSLLLGPALAGSRMGLLLALLGVLTVLFYVLWRYQRPRWMMGLAIFIFAGVFFTLSFGPIEKSNLSVTAHIERNMDRVFIWQRAVEIFVDHPLFGTGYGHYPKVAPMVYHTSDPWRPENNHAHNIALTLLAETGIVGLFAFLFLGYRWGQAFWRRRKEGLAASAFGSCMVFISASLVHDPWFHSNLLTVFWWFAAMACVPEPEVRSAHD